MSNYNPNRVAAGKSDGGQFAAKVNGEQDIDLDIPSGADTFNDPYAALSENASPVSLTYVEQGDQLSKEQIEHALSGDWRGVYDDVDDSFRDQAYERASEIAREEIDFLHSEGKFHSEWEDLDEEQQAEAIRAVQGRDDSDPVKDLLKNTHDQDLRITAANTDDFTKEYTSEGVAEAIKSFPEGVSIDDVLADDEDGKYTEERIALLNGVLKDHGVDTDDDGVRISVRTYVEERSYTDWRETDIDVVWHGSVHEVTPSTPENVGENLDRVVTIRNAEIVMTHGDAGTETSGGSIPAPIRKRIGERGYGDHVKLDENPYGSSRNPIYVPTEEWVKG